MADRSGPGRSVVVSLFLVTLVTLVLEISMTRVFDIALYPNLAYFVISTAILGLGLGGVWAAVRPTARGEETPWLRRYAAAVGVLAVCQHPLINAVPFNFDRAPDHPLEQAGLFLAIFVVVMLPFFYSGLFLSVLFSRWAAEIQRLYFWDLVGAGLGCLLVPPLIGPIGPGGLLYVGGGLALVAVSVLPTERTVWRVMPALAGVLLCAVPFVIDGYLAFSPHMSKRGVLAAHREGRVEYTVWDPISKIEVVREEDTPWNYHIAYDGGVQSSRFYRFDGDYDALRAGLDDTLLEHFWGKYSVVSHWLLEGTAPEVLVLGSAGGAEVKAALTFGASHVDAVELVGAVVDLAGGRYADYTGGVYLDPRVSAHVDEGRSFLRRAGRRYDLIQIHSNHTSSSIAQGIGAMAPVYLQTAEAYEQFFEALDEDGLLHINHYYYPRMVTTAALAWERSGRTDFERHVIVVRRLRSSGFLPTLLIRMSPWTAGDVERVRDFFAHRYAVDPFEYEIAYDPTDPGNGRIPRGFFASPLDPTLIEGMVYDVRPTTDDRPFFAHVRRVYRKIDPAKEKYITTAVESVLNGSLRKGIPMDIGHLIGTGLVSILFCGVFVFIPLRLSPAGRARWPGKPAALAYFSCLGIGFIIIELVMIQVLMHLVGFPLYAVTTVLFTVLLGAGLGSRCSEWLELGRPHRARWVFPAILGSVAIFTLVYPVVVDLAAGQTLPIRILLAAVLVLPTAFLLGVPFPIGIFRLRDRPDAVPWAWAMNGLFTVVGGLASVLLALQFGFRVTLLLASVFYLIAGWLYGRLPGTARRGEVA